MEAVLRTFLIGLSDTETSLLLAPLSAGRGGLLLAISVGK
jgi:hypothetical protein